MATSQLKLYGNISDWNNNSATEMVERLNIAASSSDTVELHIHSYGGSVVEGNMIYNAIAKCPKPVHVYIDGIAASQASIVAMAGTRRYMAENAFLMVHAPAGGTGGRGTAADHAATAKALTAMERMFVKTLTSASGRPEAEVKRWLAADTWFSAAEALEMGLIDGIVDPVAKSIAPPPAESIATSSVDTIYNLYTAALDSKPNINNQKSTMNKELLIKTLGLKGVTAESSDAEVEAAIVAYHAAATKTAADAEDRLRASAEAQITAELDPIKSKVTAEQMTHFREVGCKCGIEALRAVIKPIVGTVSITDMIGKGSAGAAAAGSASWNFDQWQKNDPTGLEKLAREDYDGFNALYKAKFGTEAPKQ